MYELSLVQSSPQEPSTPQAAVEATERSWDSQGNSQGEQWCETVVFLQSQHQKLSWRQLGGLAHLSQIPGTSHVPHSQLLAFQVSLFRWEERVWQRKGQSLGEWASRASLGCRCEERETVVGGEERGKASGGEGRARVAVASSSASLSPLRHPQASDLLLFELVVTVWARGWEMAAEASSTASPPLLVKLLSWPLLSLLTLLSHRWGQENEELLGHRL